MEGANKALLAIINEFPKAEGSTLQGLSDTEIKLGCTNDETLAGAPANLAGFCKGAEARIANANTNKDLEQEIKLVSSTDTGGDPTSTANAWTELTSSDKVFAVLAQTSSGNPAQLESAHIPYFGIAGSSCGVQSVFGFTTGEGVFACFALSAETKGAHTVFTDGLLNAVAKSLDLSSVSDVKYAAAAQDGAQLKAAADALSGLYKAAGATIANVTTGILPASQSVDFGPTVQSLLEGDPNTIGMFMYDQATLTGLTGALRQAGYKGAILGVFSESLLENPTVAQQVDGSFNTTSGWGDPAFESDSWDIVKADAESVDSDVSAGFVQGWLAADLFIQGMSSYVDSEGALPTSTEAFVNFLNDGWVYNGFGDVSAPTTFPYGHYAAPPCAAITALDAKAGKAVGKVDVTCGKVYVS
jgi:hypothetical protein